MRYIPILFFVSCCAAAPAADSETSALVRSEGVQNLRRGDLNYVISVPEGCLRGGCGLIVDLHGYRMNAAVEEAGSKLQALGAAARQRGARTPYVVIQPETKRKPSSWVAGDANEIYAVASQIAKELSIDRHRIHVGGFSQGAWIAVLIYCGHAPELASIGLVAGGAPALPPCLPAEPQAASPSILFIQNLDDALVPGAKAQEMFKAVKAGIGAKMTEQKISDTETRFSGQGMTIQFLFHHETGGFGGPHCMPGGDGLVGCPATWAVGEKLLDFYVSHTRSDAP